MKKVILISFLMFILLSMNIYSQTASQDEIYRSVLDKNSDCVVNITYILNMKVEMGQGASNRQEKDETCGIVLSQDGLILVNNSQISGGAEISMIMKTNSDQFDIKPTDFKVVLPDGSELPAKLLVKDSDLDIAFLKITDLKGKTLKPIDIDKAKEIKIGEEILGITRYGKSLHFAPRFHIFTINAILDFPRLMYDIDGSSPFLGMPAFSEDGKFIGMFATIPELFSKIDRENTTKNEAMESYGIYLLPYKDIVAAMKKIPKDETKKEDKTTTETVKK